MFFKVIYLCFIHFLSAYQTNYLNNQQWDRIQKIIQHNETPINIKNKVNQIIYHSYEKWAINQAYKFKFFHRYKSRNIQIEDFILSSKVGLYKSIQKYNGKTNFVMYSKKYIQGELYKCLTEFHGITSITKSQRRKKKVFTNKIERKKYRKQTQSSLISYSDYWRFDKIRLYLENEQSDILEKYIQREKHQNLWINIYNNSNNRNSSTKTFSERAFSYKYDYDFIPIRSNLQISRLMGCSEEWVRKNLKCFNNDILDKR